MPKFNEFRRFAGVEYPTEQVVDVTIKHPYVVVVTFNDGVRREVDIEPLMWGEVFAPLKDPALFAMATVDHPFGSVCWPTGADLAPEFLYYGLDTPYGPVEISATEHAVAGAEPQS